MANNNRLGELLVREKLISLTQLRHAQDEQQKSGNNLGYTLAKLGYVSDDEITSFLSQQYRVPTINLEEYEVDADVLKLVPKEPCERHKVLPVSRTGNSLIVAMADPTNLPCPPSSPDGCLRDHRRRRSLARGPSAVKLRPHGQQQPAG